MCSMPYLLRIFVPLRLLRLLLALGLSAAVSLAHAGATATDFNGDQSSDILWRGPDGEVAIWLMQGEMLQSAVVVATVPLSWTIVGVGDFDGDGDCDILWRGPKGEVAIWLMHGTTIKSAVVLGTVPLTWTIAGVGDFNGDGKADILWRGPNNVVAFWMMNGTSIASAPVLPFGMNSYWSVGAVDDFNGDGTSDLLWLGSNGEVALWDIQNGTIAQSAVIATVPAGQRVVGTGRITYGVGADILWADVNGRPTLWQLNGMAPPTSTFVFLPDATSSVAAVGGYFGGSAEILIRDKSGTPSFMNYDNRNFNSEFDNYTFSQNVPTNWVPYSPRSNLTTVQPASGGASWQAIESVPTTSTLNSLQMLSDNQTGFAAGSLNAGGPVFLKTVNGGSSWTSINTTGKTTSGINAMQFLDNLNGYIVGVGEETANALTPAYGTYRALRTTDGGASWTDIGNTISTWYYDQIYYDVHFTDSMHGWVLGSNFGGETTPDEQNIYATADGGITWKATAVQYAGLTSIRAGDNLHVLCFAPNTYDVYERTEDGGATWALMRVPMQAQQSKDSISDIQFVGALNVFAVGHTVSNAFASVWYSADAGKTWVQRSSPSNALSKVSFSSVTSGVAIDSNGGLYRTTDGAVTWTTLIAPNASQFAQMPNLISAGTTAFWSLVVLPSQSSSGNATVIGESGGISLRRLRHG